METHINAILETAERPAALAVVAQISVLLDSLDACLVDENLLPAR